MNQSNEGLTVGELTIAVGVLLILFLLWTGISKKPESKNNLSTYNHYQVIKVI